MCGKSDIIKPQATASASWGIPVEERTDCKDPTASWHSLLRIKTGRRQLHGAELWQLARPPRCHTVQDGFPQFLQCHFLSIL